VCRDIRPASAPLAYVLHHTETERTSDLRYSCETSPGLIGIREGAMNNIFYIIGVVVVVLVILGYFGFR
jgi:hypothetical protein